MERTGKELLIASKDFAEEHRARSWWCFWSSLSLLALLVTIACAPWFSLLANISASILAGFLIVRVFVIFHDFFHGAILQRSYVAYSIMYLFGMLVLSPARSWKHTHDHHHVHNSNHFGAQLGSFPLMTTTEYASSSFWKRLGYRLIRSPFIILFGYITGFLINKTIVKFIEDPVRNHSCGIALLIHIGLVILIGSYSIKMLLLGMVLPLAIGAAVGTYMFYVQHNFPGMKRREGKEWDYVYAALNSSSCMRLSPLMNWLTGNIGYHHVHHLNAKIPFYRLPEAMANMRELQTPVWTSLRFKDMLKCLQLKLWDPNSEQLMTFREAKLAASVD